MKIKILQAGYIGDGISTILKNEFPEESIFLDTTSNVEILKLKGLLEMISNFSIKTNRDFTIDYNQIPKCLAVQNNILTRGIPTRSPLFLERLLEDIGLSTIDDSKTFEYKFDVAQDFKNVFNYKNVFKKLHIIFPKLNIARKNYLGQLGSNLESKFLENSHPIFKQILQTQREFKTIANFVHNESWVDFSHTIPYLFKEKINSPFNGEVFDNIYKTKVLEVDGPHHFLKENIYYDALRDNLVEEANGEVVRYPFFEIEKNNVGANNSINSELENIYITNFEADIVEELALSTYLLLPFSVARLQKFFVELFIRNPEFLKRDSLKFCVIERDIPGAAIALKLFKDSIEQLNELVEDSDVFQIPILELYIVQNKEWLFDTHINLGCEVLDHSNLIKDDYDFVVDHSMLIRDGVYDFEKTIDENYYTLRSVHYVDSTVDSSRQIYCSESIKYKPLVLRNSDTSYTEVKESLSSIEYFLQNIFRKESFREGQLPIISRALQKLPVIGLLPTGGGKSLTYQIPAFLQPSLCIVVDPIKSLMEDQVRVLRENWIDNISYANSSQSQYFKNKAIVDFKLGSKQILFISPERFVIDEFRSVVNNIDSTEKGQSIGYCVIDEVHCVSEWGHDFRYDYLLLGKNAQKYCKSKDRAVSLVGLTATASFDVLADIERELQIEHDDVAEAIVMIENTVRPELFFRVVDVTNASNRSEYLVSEMKNFNQTFKYFNEKVLLIKSQKHHFENFDPKDFAQRTRLGAYQFNNDNQYIFNEKLGQLVDVLPDSYSAIVFCPVKGTKISENTGEFINQKGVRYNHNLLKQNTISAGYFYGSDEENDNEDTQQTIQDHFHKFMNGNISTMVCTKAFGMGIDKEDIRATFHINYSSSLESLVQECGRAGRDKKVAVATILASTKTYFAFDYLKFTDFYKGLTDFDIKVIRNNLVEYYIDEKLNKYQFESDEQFLIHLNSCQFQFSRKNGDVISLSDFKIKHIKEIVKSNLNELLIEKSEDRDIHDFFYENNFKGKRYEDAQMYRLFTSSPESDDVPEFPAIYQELENAQNDSEFTIIIPFRSKLEKPKFPYKEKFKTSDLSIYERQLILQTPFFKNIYNLFDIADDKIFEAYKIYFISQSIEEFWQKMETEKIFSIEDLKKLSQEDKYSIEEPFISQRNEIETGRLIYRLHSIGLLTGYTKDYRRKLYSCTLYKSYNIEFYLGKIEDFLKRYQSEKTAEESLLILRNKLDFESQNFLEDLIKILKYLTDFTYTEIASKRRKSTGGIKDLIERILRSNKSDYEKNIILKEEIYYYFNAKYARPNYIENGLKYSLLDDFYNNKNKRKDEILYKYIDEELLRYGTEQNNYKHLLGTCKKMLRNLTESESKKDWLLHLLLSFSLYSTNNLSYRFDANFMLETGFDRLLQDQYFLKDDYDRVMSIFETYFNHLTKNVKDDNNLLEDINLIQNKVLQKLQSIMVEKFINEFSN